MDREVKGIERERVKGREKSSQNLPNREIKRKQRLIKQNYYLAYYICRGKCGNYKDTGVSKNHPSS